MVVAKYTKNKDLVLQLVNLLTSPDKFKAKDYTDESNPFLKTKLRYFLLVLEGVEFFLN